MDNNYLMNFVCVFFSSLYQIGNVIACRNNNQNKSQFVQSNHYITFDDDNSWALVFHECKSILFWNTKHFIWMHFVEIFHWIRFSYKKKWFFETINSVLQNLIFRTRHIISFYLKWQWFVCIILFNVNLIVFFMLLVVQCVLF